MRRPFGDAPGAVGRKSCQVLLEGLNLPLYPRRLRSRPGHRVSPVIRGTHHRQGQPFQRPCLSRLPEHVGDRTQLLERGYQVRRRVVEGAPLLTLEWGQAGTWREEVEQAED